jgi:hypothetical protein
MQLRSRSLSLLLAFCLAICGAQAAASTDAALCDQAAELAAQQSQTPFEVLQAIARVETGRTSQGVTSPWPWTVNHAGKGYWFSGEAEAVDFATALLAQGDDNFDLGCFQVNQHWHGAKFASLTEALSPRRNAAVAADYLQGLFQTSGSWGGAVAGYHSQSEEAGQQYLVKVEAMLQRMRRSADAPQPEQLAQTQPENPFPLLRQGGAGRGASLVPTDGTTRPLIRMIP